jgi:hypothetical protein
MLQQLLSSAMSGARQGGGKEQEDPATKREITAVTKFIEAAAKENDTESLNRYRPIAKRLGIGMDVYDAAAGIETETEKREKQQADFVNNIMGTMMAGSGNAPAPVGASPGMPPISTPQKETLPVDADIFGDKTVLDEPNVMLPKDGGPPQPSPNLSPTPISEPRREGDFIVRDITIGSTGKPSLHIARRTLDDLKLKTFDNLPKEDKKQAAILITLGANTFKTSTNVKTGITKITGIDALGKEIGTHTLGQTQLTPAEEVSQAGKVKAAQEAEKISEHQRTIDTLQSTFPSITTEDATGIALGTLKIMQSPVTGEKTIVDTVNNTEKALSAQAGATDEKPNPARPPITVWNLTDLATGPKSAAMQAISTVTGAVGLPVAEATAQARQFVTAAQNNLIRALSINPRFPVGEINRLRDEIQLAPAIFDNPKLMRNRIIAIDGFLRQRVLDERRASRDTSLPVTARQDALEASNNIENFLVTLGAPIRVQSVEEARALKPGTHFTTPDGKLKVR